MQGMFTVSVVSPRNPEQEKWFATARQRVDKCPLPLRQLIEDGHGTAEVTEDVAFAFLQWAGWINGWTSEPIEVRDGDGKRKTSAVLIKG